MYVPPAFSVTDRRFTHELIGRYPFGLLTTCGAGFPHATHLPMLALEREDGLWLAGHVARANPQARAIIEGMAATAVFTGPHAYVSAAWYEAPSVNVPTWNYTAVHASGRLAECDASGILAALTDAFERERHEPWRVDDMDADYYHNQLLGIVAFEMRVDRLVCAAKLSQNRSDVDRMRAIDHLSRSHRPLDRECARAMREFAERARVDGEQP